VTDNFWDRHGFNKSVQERGAARLILQSAGFEIAEFGSRQNDPPDCEGLLDGQWSAVEVTRLTHKETRTRSMKAVKQRAAGREPKIPEASYVWERADLLQAIQNLIKRKDLVDYKGSTYQRHVLIIHTDEAYLNRSNVEQFLKGSDFRARSLNDVVLGLSYHPASGGYPTFRLNLIRPN
jgi:hypothetical protein